MALALIPHDCRTRTVVAAAAEAEHWKALRPDQVLVDETIQSALEAAAAAVAAVLNGLLPRQQS